MTLGTILTAMVTPFDRYGALDPIESERLARWLVDRNTDGLIVAGSTGEGQTLDAAERVALCKAVKEAVGSRAAVVVNAGSNDTRASIAAVAEAAGAGADAILAVVPYYSRPTQSGMIAHFAAIAQSTALPIVVYNIPGRTAANMLPETLLELAQRHANIVGVKESSGDLKQIGTILRDRPAGFKVWSGRVDEAAVIHAAVLPLIDALFATSNPIPVKWAMREIGFAVGECRLPLDAMPEALAKRLRPLLAAFDVA